MVYYTQTCSWAPPPPRPPRIHQTSIHMTGVPRSSPFLHSSEYKPKNKKRGRLLFHSDIFDLVSCPAGNNLWKILACLSWAFAHVSRVCTRPVLAIYGLHGFNYHQLVIHTSTRVPVGRPSNWTCYNLIGTFK